MLTSVRRRVQVPLVQDTHKHNRVHDERVASTLVIPQVLARRLVQILLAYRLIATIWGLSVAPSQQRSKGVCLIYIYIFVGWI
jgi:hypothetical protein